MDFSSLTRRELQALCKINGIPANKANASMADSLKSLPIVEGVDDLDVSFKSPLSESGRRGPLTSYRRKAFNSVQKSQGTRRSQRLVEKIDRPTLIERVETEAVRLDDFCEERTTGLDGSLVENTEISDCFVSASGKIGADQDTSVEEASISLGFNESQDSGEDVGHQKGFSVENTKKSTPSVISHESGINLDTSLEGDSKLPEVICELEPNELPVKDSDDYDLDTSMEGNLTIMEFQLNELPASHVDFKDSNDHCEKDSYLSVENTNNSSLSDEIGIPSSKTDLETSRKENSRRLGDDNLEVIIGLEINEPDKFNTIESNNHLIPMKQECFVKSPGIDLSPVSNMLLDNEDDTQRPEDVDRLSDLESILDSLSLEGSILEDHNSEAANQNIHVSNQVLGSHFASDELSNGPNKESVSENPLISDSDNPQSEVDLKVFSSYISKEQSPEVNLAVDSEFGNKLETADEDKNIVVLELLEKENPQNPDHLQKKNTGLVLSNNNKENMSMNVVQKACLEAKSIRELKKMIKNKMQVRVPSEL